MWMVKITLWKIQNSSLSKSLRLCVRQNNSDLQIIYRSTHRCCGCIFGDKRNLLQVFFIRHRDSPVHKCLGQNACTVAQNAGECPVIHLINATGGASGFQNSKVNLLPLQLPEDLRHRAPDGAVYTGSVPSDNLVIPNFNGLSPKPARTSGQTEMTSLSRAKSATFWQKLLPPLYLQLQPSRQALTKSFI